jgi:hypothetical protein
LLSAAQRITLNGTINANGLKAGVGFGTSQGGAGGSVRLAGLLVEGAGTVTTSAGADSDNVVRSPSGPVEVQAFLQDLFAGTATTNPIRGNAPVQPIPANLPLISLDQVNAPALSFQQFGMLNKGSLTNPDVLLPPISTAQVVVTISASTQNILDGTILVFRAVGTDGSVSTATSSVSSAAAAANLNFNAGATYQIVVTSNTPFPSQVLNPAQGIELSRITPESRSAMLNENAAHALDRIAQPGDSALAEQWMKAFGMPVEMASNTNQASGGAGNGD